MKTKKAEGGRLGLPAAAASFFLLLAPPAALSLQGPTSQTTYTDVKCPATAEIPAPFLAEFRKRRRSYLPSPFLEVSALPFMVEVAARVRS